MKSSVLAQLGPKTYFMPAALSNHVRLLGATSCAAQLYLYAVASSATRSVVHFDSTEPIDPARNPPEPSQAPHPAPTTVATGEKKEPKANPPTSPPGLTECASGN